MDQFAPSTQDDVVEVVKAAIANERPLEVGGHFSMTGLGRPVEASARVSTRALRSIHFYEPSELVVSAGAGTPMRELQELLDQHGQELAFEPIDYGPLYGTDRLAGTVGGAIAINASGPRRIKAGAARDHMLGFNAVSGRGETFQSGGRVMKNVTGYDLSKLMTGSYGTLAILTDVTLKVLPKPEMELTLLFYGLRDADAVTIMTEASGLPHEVSSFAHLPAIAAAALGREALPITALRLEGPEISVTKRRQDLLDHFADRIGEHESIAHSSSRSFWADIRDVVPFTTSNNDVWRISVAPAAGANICKDLMAAGIISAHYYDWAGGLVWLATATPATRAEKLIRSAVTDHGRGHATLVRASAECRASVDVFQPQPTPLAALTARVKESFDPERILNRGRMRGDF